MIGMCLRNMNNLCVNKYEKNINVVIYYDNLSDG